MELLKLLSAGEVVAQVLSFLLLLILLRIFFWKKILKTLDDRKERIAAEFNKIKDAEGQIAVLKSDYEEKLSRIEDIAKAKFQEAMDEGKKLSEEVRKKAQEGAQDIIEDARKSIEYELSKAKEELKNQIVDLTIRAAEDLIQEKLTEEGDRKLVENFLEKIEKIEE